MFLLGNVTIGANYRNATEILNLCMYYGIAFSRLKTDDDGVTLCFRLSEFLRFKKTADCRDVEYTVLKKQGIPFILSRYKRRYGIAVGVLLAVVTVILAHNYVWSIEVEGNSTLTSAEVRQMLAERDFFVGSRISDANTDRIENQIMIESDRISWMSINIIGAVAHVQIREYGSKPNEENAKKPANLIAKKAGLVEEVRLFRGNAVVSAGKYVEKGELLVSGLFDSNQIGFRYTRAAGSVMARTEEQIYVEIPLEYESREYTGEEYCEKYVKC
jgi:similar to stage IV sporulation protein